MIEFVVALTILINKERVMPLKVDPILMSKAQERAEYLCKHKQWSHEGWRKSFENVKTTGYIGENLARDFADATSTHKALMNSPTHKDNIVNTKYRDVGIGQSCGITVELFKS